ncbi:MAG: hypothetical protein K6G90_08670 [Clostridia bacterium]|nr:hypothetical protein [Clostridia bacterium]
MKKKRILFNLLIAIICLACAVAVPLSQAHATEAAPETTTASSSASGGIGGFLEGIGLSPDIFTGTDFGKIIEDVGNLTALEDLVGLAQDAYNTGTQMLQDVANGGKGTSDGSKTASDPATTAAPQTTVMYQIAPQTTAPTTAPATTTAPAATRSDTTGPSGTAPASAAPATGPAASAPATQAASAADAPAAQVPAAAEPTTALAAAVTVPNNVNVQEEQTGGRIPTLVIVIVLAIVTVTVIVCIVVFFIRKKYY